MCARVGGRPRHALKLLVPGWFHSTRLETRTKECNHACESWGGKPVGTNESEGRHWSTEARASYRGAHCRPIPGYAVVGFE